MRRLGGARRSTRITGLPKLRKVRMKKGRKSTRRAAGY